MRKYLTIGLLGLLVMGFSASDVFAHTKKFEPPENLITFSFFINPLRVGYKHLISRNVYLTGNIDYIGDRTDLIFQAGAAYMIPRKILIFRLYGGGGLEFSRNKSYMYPYVMVGTKLWIFHFDISHPLRKHRTPEYRFGFIFSF